MTHNNAQMLLYFPSSAYAFTGNYFAVMVGDIMSIKYWPAAAKSTARIR